MDRINNLIKMDKEIGKFKKDFPLAAAELKIIILRYRKLTGYMELCKAFIKIDSIKKISKIESNKAQNKNLPDEDLLSHLIKRKD